MFETLGFALAGIIVGYFLARFLLEYFDEVEDEIEIFCRKLKEQNERKMK